MKLSIINFSSSQNLRLLFFCVKGRERTERLLAVNLQSPVLVLVRVRVFALRVEYVCPTYFQGIYKRMKECIGRHAGRKGVVMRL